MDKALKESPLQFPFDSFGRSVRVSVESVGQVVAEACCTPTNADANKREGRNAFIGLCLQIKNSAQIKSKIKSAVPPPSTGLGEECPFEHALGVRDVQLEDMTTCFNIHAK